LFLHAKKIEFKEPATGETVIFEAPLDDELKQFIKKL